MIPFTEDDVAALAERHYGLKAAATRLGGYDEQNFLLRDAASGARYVLKISDDGHGRDFLDAQVAILEHLSASAAARYFQRHLRNAEGNTVTTLSVDGMQHYLRVLDYLEGRFWADLDRHPDALLLSLGRMLGETDVALRDFRHPAMHRRYAWDIQTALDALADVAHIRDPAQRRLAGYFLLQFETEALPQLHGLRTAYIHGDANDHNLLVQGDAVAGLIDFGDMVHSPLVNNLAVACTYAMFRQPDALHAASQVVRGYHQRLPLRETEIDLLYYLIAARLCISVTRSAARAAQGSDNAHHFVTERDAWQLLHVLLETNPVKARETFRAACGFAPAVPPEEDHAALEAERRSRIGRNLSISYRRHLKIERGALQYLYDDRGNTFVDCVNNVSHVGHCHPGVARAMRKQIATLNTNTRYLHDGLVEYARRITATLPPQLSVCYFTNSGSEANDLAIRMSRQFTGRRDVIVLDHAYHGTSTVAMELSPYKFDGKGGGGRMPWVHKAASPDLYRGPFRYGDGEAGEKYAADVARIIGELRAQSNAPAAFICETLLGVGGQMPLPAGYLHAVYRHVRAAGGVCIADEVQVGFGRVGECFWGFELQGVQPDIVVLGKPIGNGHPLAAVVVTEAIAQSFANGMEYFNTFGGNPVSMATGLAVLDAIRDEGMQQHALHVGRYLLDALAGLMRKHPLIGDVRGHGLFVGVELVRDRRTLEPAVQEIDVVVERMKQRGFLLSTDGPLHNVLKIKPPLVFSLRDAERMVATLDDVLGGLAQDPR